MQDTDKESVRKRLARIAGQVNGVARMVEEDRYCIDILHQTAAIRAALTKVENAVLDNHARHCIADAVRSGDPEDQRRKFDELLDLMGRVRR